MANRFSMRYHEEPGPSITYAELLAREGGMATCGNHLGLMVAPRNAVERCPRGWIFLALEDATPQRVEELLAEARQGRKSWPEHEGAS